MEINKPTLKELRNEIFNSEGSNPGRVRLNPIRWIRMNPMKIITQLLGLLISLYLMVKVHWVIFPIFIGFLIWTIYHWWSNFTVFKVGDVNPGKVIHLNPDRIAVVTNMTKGFGNYPIIRIIEINLLKEDRELNKVIPTIAGYTNNPFGYPFWSEFHPIPINHGVANREKLKQFENTYNASDIQRIDEYLLQIKTIEPETYKIDEETSDWKNFKNVLVGNLDKMKSPKVMKENS